MNHHITVIAILMGWVLFSCEKKPTSSQPQDPKAVLLTQGKAIFQAQCVSCHGTNPKQSGPIGPEVWGASRELLQKRVLEAAYPEGYHPKRMSKIMPALPFLKGEIEALHTYLNAP